MINVMRDEKKYNFLIVSFTVKRVRADIIEIIHYDDDR